MIECGARMPPAQARVGGAWLRRDGLFSAEEMSEMLDTGVITCKECGLQDRNLSRFNKHAPCAPIDDTVWMMMGSSGWRVPNTEDDVRRKTEELFAQDATSDNIRVHHGQCVLGITLPGGCDCYPITVFRPSTRPRQIEDDGSGSPEGGQVVHGRWLDPYGRPR